MDTITKNMANISLPKDESSASIQNTTNDDEKELSASEKSLLQKIVRSGLVISDYDVEMQWRDPTYRIERHCSFQHLRCSKIHPNILRGWCEMGYNAPSKLQAYVLPSLFTFNFYRNVSPLNLIVQSQSGTGKTTAFVLAMLNRVDPSLQYPQVICLSPTYELAIKIGEVAAKMSTFCSYIKLRYAVRGEDIEKGTKLQEQIIVGTPGNVLDWITKYKFLDPKMIKVCVLDKADIMVDTQGHQDQSFRIRKLLQESCQMVFSSETYTEDVLRFANAIAPMSNIIRLKREKRFLNNVNHFRVFCYTKEDKYNSLVNIYRGITIEQAMIFCQTKSMAQWLVTKMTNQGHAVALLSGELTVQQRISVLDRFREGKEKVLVTTNVFSRGIDIEQVTIVIYFDLPVTVSGEFDYESYLHRIGHTWGHRGKKRIAINFFNLATYDSLSVLNQIQDDFEILMVMEYKFRIPLAPLCAYIHMDETLQNTCNAVDMEELRASDNSIFRVPDFTDSETSEDSEDSEDESEDSEDGFFSVLNKI